MKNPPLTMNQLLWLITRGGRSVDDVFYKNGLPYVLMQEGRDGEKPFFIPPDQVFYFSHNDRIFSTKNKKREL